MPNIASSVNEGVIERAVRVMIGSRMKERGS